MLLLFYADSRACCSAAKIIGSHKTTEENKIFSLKVGVIIAVTVKTR